MNPAYRLHSAPRSKPVSSPIRILTAVPICDGHDSAIITINLELIRSGVEVIYLGYNRSARDIVRAAIQEDVHAVGISSYNGGHVEFFGEVLSRLRRHGAEIAVFGGGGGTITPGDARIMKRRGVDEIFFAGTPLDDMVAFVIRNYGNPSYSTHRRPRAPRADGELARALTLAGTRASPAVSGRDGENRRTSAVVGVTGPGGAGKTTLIDELTLRFLDARPRGRLAILSHDPSLGGKGALLGDRATMVYAQDDRVFMRSLATRGNSGGLASGTRRCLETLKAAGFDMVLVESTGIGQEDLPFPGGLVDKQVLVMSPDYGSRLQLQKIVMLEAADIVVVNKSDLPAARTALSEIEQRLALNRRAQQLIATVAKRHRDPGVDELFTKIIA
jgi:methylmalonyl-CoA mutase